MGVLVWVAWLRLLLDSLMFEPKDWTQEHLLALERLVMQQPLMWKLSPGGGCCPTQRLVGPKVLQRTAPMWPWAQLSPSCLHSVISAYGLLRWLPLRQKVETISKGSRQTASPLLSWCYTQLGKKYAAFEHVTTIADVKRSKTHWKRMRDKGGEWFSPKAHQQELGTAMFSLSCPCTWCR